jgi:hypothetical protein
VVSGLADYARRMSRDVTLFKLGEHAHKDHTIGAWTHPGALLHMATSLVVDPEVVRRQTLVNAAVQMYRASPISRAFVDEYVHWCCVRSVVAGDPATHRHDQSVLSILASTYGANVDLWRDPTQYGQNDPPLGPAVKTPLLDHHRQRLPLAPKVAVITATTGGRHLRACLQSVQAQTYPNIEHWVFADGPEHHAAVKDVVADFKHKMPIVPVYLPRNTGADGWNGHR